MTAVREGSSARIAELFSAAVALPPLDDLASCDLNADQVDDLVTLMTRFFLRRALRLCFQKGVAEWSELGYRLLDLGPAATWLAAQAKFMTWVNAATDEVWDDTTSRARLADLLSRADADPGEPIDSTLSAFWLETRIPGSPEPGRDVDGVEFTRAVTGARAIVEQVWPGAALEIAATVQVVLPLLNPGPKPGYTAHRSRGVIWARQESPSELAQILVHESGHSTLCSVIDLANLATNQRQVVWSPIGEDRPLYGLFHAAFSFARETRFSTALLEFGDLGSREADLVTWNGQVRALARESLDILDRDAVLTDEGTALCAGLERCLAP